MFLPTFIACWQITFILSVEYPFLSQRLSKKDKDVLITSQKKLIIINYKKSWLDKDFLSINPVSNTKWIQFQRSEDLAVSNIAVKIDDTVKYLSGPIDKMMPNHKELIYNVKRDLIDTVTERPTVTTETQTSRSMINFYIIWLTITK